jgi:diguanylate cyclase (GGDEF)-like protein
MKSEVLSKVLWRLYVFILLVSIFLLAIGSSFMWKSIVNEAKTEMTYSNKIVSRSLFSLLSKDEALFRISGERLLELGLFKDNPQAIKLLDDLLINNPELAGIGIANPEGEILLSSSNFNTKNLPNLLQKKETMESFKRALNSDSLVMGRTYFLKEFNDWIVPIRYRILNKNKEVVAVFTSGIKVKGNNSPWLSANIEDTLRVSVIASDYYFQFVSFIKDDELEKFYNRPINNEYLEFFSKTLFLQTGLTINDFMEANHGIVFLEYIAPTGENLIATFSYDLKFGHFIFTTLLKSTLQNKFMVPMIWLCSLLIGFNIILFYLFRYLSKLQRKSKADLEQQSQHDQLTGLPNLRHLSKIFKRWKKTHGKLYSVIYIDLDNFKSSNDIHGHPVGDEILIEVALRLQLFFKDGMCVRQGGDEFIVITPNTQKNNILDVCHDFLLDLKQPIKVEDLEFSIRASIGISQSSIDGEDIETLLRKADIAMYEAKRRKCGVYIFTQKLNKQNTRRAMIGKELNYALEKSEFTLVYQPQFDVSTKKIIGVEALLRWDNNILKQVSPSEFIPIAESTGAIIDIGKFVFEKAFEEFQEICHEFLEKDESYSLNNRFRLSVNVSILQLSNEHFLESLFELIEKYDCVKAKLMVEITETLIIANLDKIGAVLDRIRQSGIEVSLDDFGTGYSSLSHLTKLPINELKIDKSFVHGITTDKNNLTLIKSIINLGHSLGIDVLAEGVETEEQFDILNSYQCKYVQGFYFSKPLDKTNLLKFLKK